MNSNNISSNISPKEMAELNNEDAKQFDVGIGIVINDMPGEITKIKTLLDEAETKINSLKTRNLNFDIITKMETLVKNYDTFSQEILNYVGYYELEIVTIINIFDRMNSLDGSLTVDNNYFDTLPFVGTMLFTLLGYFGNSNLVDDLPQLALDVTGNVMDRDFNETMGNLLYNGVESVGQALFGSQKFWPVNIAAYGALTLFELLYEMPSHSKEQIPILILNAFGDGSKLVLGNAVANYWAIPVATNIFNKISGAGFATAEIAEVIGGVTGGIVGAGIVVVADIAIDHIVEPIVNEMTGEAFIDGTSIPRNGGELSLYSDYINALDPNIYTSDMIDRTVLFNGMTVSADYCREMSQINPIDTLSGLDDFNYVEGSTWAQTLDNYLNDLAVIPSNSSNFEEQVNQLTSNAMLGTDGSGANADYIRYLVNEIGFDPCRYAEEN